LALLDTIGSPEDIRLLPADQLPELAAEVRERILDVVSGHKGAHFGSNLGTVELTIALHRVFQTPKDQLVWDVGHQAYPHKILTGRNAEFPSIRKKGGLSPFLRRDESEYDTFGAGHAATSISAACGMAAARDLRDDEFEVVAVIGDGSMTCGLAYEALNNAGHTDRDLVVVLNDNQMSISPNVGAMHSYLTNVRTHPLYNKVREEVKRLIHSAPRMGSIGAMVEGFAVRVDDAIKGMFVPGMIFEELGFRYIGRDLLSLSTFNKLYTSIMVVDNFIEGIQDAFSYLTHLQVGTDGTGNFTDSAILSYKLGILNSNSCMID
jgi:1-deoxy-D-xylulose-5-phosphate synthase